MSDKGLGDREKEKEPAKPATPTISWSSTFPAVVRSTRKEARRYAVPEGE